MVKDLYGILGVSSDADESTLKKAYRNLAKKYHPDLHPDDAEAEAKFKEINEAFALLSDPDKRSAYDKARQSSPKQRTTASKTNASRTSKPQSGPTNFSQMKNSFAQFFGFDPATGQIVDEEKLHGQKSNPLDTTDLFNRFMGFK